MKYLQFYNFVGNDYPRKKYLLIKILKKNGRTKSSLTNSFNKSARKISCNMKISSGQLLDNSNQINFFTNSDR